MLGAVGSVANWKLDGPCCTSSASSPSGPKVAGGNGRAKNPGLILAESPEGCKGRPLPGRFGNAAGGLPELGGEANSGYSSNRDWRV
jgi:hypothetical protein